VRVRRAGDFTAIAAGRSAAPALGAMHMLTAAQLAQASDTRQQT